MVTFGFDDSGVNFWLRYFLDDMGRRDAIDGGVRDRVWYSLERAGIALSFPARAVSMQEISEATEQTRAGKKLQDRVQAISGIDLFASLDPENTRRLAEDARAELFAAGETVIRRGEQGDSMFVVKSGEVAVRVDNGAGGEKEAARLSTGAFFGEMSLLTGDPRQATVVAVSSCELLVIDHAAFRALFTAHPEIAKTISDKVIERRRGLADAQATPSMKQAAEVEKTALVGRIRSFFGL